MNAVPRRAFILAGGRATRMGSDKARAPFFLADGTLISLAVATALPLVSMGVEVTIVRRIDCVVGPWTLPDGQTLSELIEPDAPTHHPLWGVTFALTQVSKCALIVPCDMPWVSKKSWQRILAQQAPVVAMGDDGVHPLLGSFPADWQVRAKALAVSQGRVSTFAAAAEHIRLPAKELRNANSPLSLKENWRGRIAQMTMKERVFFEQQGLVFPLKR